MYKEILKQGVKFTTTKGECSVEQLLQLTPTESNATFLERIAIELGEAYDNSKAKSLRGRKTKKDKNLKLQYDVVVDILSDMDVALDAVKESVGNKEKLQELLAIKAERQKEKTKDISDDELEKQIKRYS